jgi:DNA-binding MarR family transcriptional regulator
MAIAIPLSAQVSRVINQLLFLEKRSVFTHRGVTLHPSELHLLGALMRDGDANVTTMAETLGITKGAVSQTISRLVTKGMVTKTRDPLNKNELKVRFTTPGKKAIEAFAKFRAETNRQYETYLSGLADAERQTIRTFLTQVERMIAGLK